MADKLEDAEFASKINWEGGVTEALDYGLRTSDLKNPDSELGQLWKVLEEYWAKMKPTVSEVEDLVEDLVGDA